MPEGQQNSDVANGARRMLGAAELPEGEYAIVEIFGHTTLIGRISEVERFGAKMLSLEPLFDGLLLPPVFHGGAAIYRLTPCSAEIAFKRQPRHAYQLPAPVLAIVPDTALPAPELVDLDSDVGEDEERPF